MPQICQNEVTPEALDFVSCLWASVCSLEQEGISVFTNSQFWFGSEFFVERGEWKSWSYESLPAPLLLQLLKKKKVFVGLRI